MQSAHAFVTIAINARQLALPARRTRRINAAPATGERPASRNDDQFSPKRASLVRSIMKGFSS